MNLRVLKSTCKTSTDKKRFNSLLVLLSGGSVPKDQALYDRTKEAVYSKIPKHSAYRSGVVVQEYKRKYAAKYGSGKSPYIGQRESNKGLSRWFKEKWRNQRGGVGYKYKSDVYRPTVRVTKKTPKTFKELGSSIKRARLEKSRTGRVRRFQSHISKRKKQKRSKKSKRSKKGKRSKKRKRSKKGKRSKKKKRSQR